MQPSQIILQLPRTSHYSSIDIEVQSIMGKLKIASHIMFAKILQRVDEDGDDDVDEDAYDDHAGGGWSPPESISTAFPPSGLLRWRHADSLFM
jgi:hypothetical protein